MAVDSISSTDRPEGGEALVVGDVPRRSGILVGEGQLVGYVVALAQHQGEFAVILVRVALEDVGLQLELQACRRSGVASAEPSSGVLLLTWPPRLAAGLAGAVAADLVTTIGCACCRLSTWQECRSPGGIGNFLQRGHGVGNMRQAAQRTQATMKTRQFICLPCYLGVILSKSVRMRSERCGTITQTHGRIPFFFFSRFSLTSAANDQKARFGPRARADILAIADFRDMVGAIFGIGPSDQP